mmetsp:Transcript_154630/g.495775  ORF Transcript_154630/g.495775 Transcript_154630/m.495775 type:complete len:110 (-) Transcript_154630:602-931(-)
MDVVVNEVVEAVFVFVVDVSVVEVPVPVLVVVCVVVVVVLPKINVLMASGTGRDFGNSNIGKDGGSSPSAIEACSSWWLGNMQMGSRLMGPEDALVASEPGVCELNHSE